jgi:carboxyl-terminal processing protease
MKSNAFRIAIGGILVLVLLAGTCSAGFVAGRMLTPSTSAQPVSILPGADGSQTNPTPSTANGTPGDLKQLFAPFWQAWQLVHDQYVDQPVDDVSLMRGAIKGMLEALGDQHTSYIDPEQLKSFNSQLQGEEYEGIGAWVDTSSDYLTIISPMPGSPAEKAGLKNGDQIIAVDGEDMTGIDGELVRQRVIGPAGSTVVLTIRRPGKPDPFDVKIARASITSSNVIGRMLDNNVAYVHLIAFGDEKTTEDLRTTLSQLLDQHPVGLILDLRNNGGGYLNSAIDVASEFMDNGVVVYEQYGDGTRNTFEAKSGGVATEIPMVVLINEGSASASEIVAGAIQDHQRGQLVGTKSYGKGSVQVWTDLVDNQGAVRVTVARWLTPNERTIHGVGLTPDVEVQITEDDIQNGRDPQLDKAVELLTQN